MIRRPPRSTLFPYTTALPIFRPRNLPGISVPQPVIRRLGLLTVDDPLPEEDRKSTRLNSSHSQISYAVFCLKKKKNTNHRHTHTHTPHNTPLTTPHTTTVPAT